MNLKVDTHRIETATDPSIVNITLLHTATATAPKKRIRKNMSKMSGTESPIYLRTPDSITKAM